VRGGWHADKLGPGERGGHNAHSPSHVSRKMLRCAADAPPYASTCVPGSHRLLVHVGAATPQRVPMIKITNTGLASGVRATCSGSGRCVWVCVCVWRRGGGEGPLRKAVVCFLLMF
jgi:hypothetical protein